MIITIDIDILKTEGISADDFTALYLLYNKQYDIFDSLKLIWNPENLEEKGFLKVMGETPKDYIVRQEFLDLFLDSFDRMFAELLNTYPMKVNINGSVRVLHAIDPKAKNNLKSKKKYQAILSGKPYLHKHIIKCLDNQLNIMRGSLGYMQNLETWLNNHTWEKYEDVNIDDDENRITRSL
jgi:hypothetical protein